MVYLDTSALVKLYVEETGSHVVQEAVRQARSGSTSRVAYVEARAVFTWKYWEGRLAREECTRIVHEFEKDWGNYFIVEVSDAVT